MLPYRSGSISSRTRCLSSGTRSVALSLTSFATLRMTRSRLRNREPPHIRTNQETQGNQCGPVLAARLPSLCRQGPSPPLRVWIASGSSLDNSVDRLCKALIADKPELEGRLGFHARPRAAVIVCKLPQDGVVSGFGGIGRE